MSRPLPPPTHTGHQPPVTGNAAPRRTKVTAGLAALACAACCALPVLIAAGVLTGAGAAILERTLLAVAAGLSALALGMWWLHRRRPAHPGAPSGTSGRGAPSGTSGRGAPSGTSGCGGSGCGCRTSARVRHLSHAAPAPPSGPPSLSGR